MANVSLDGKVALVTGAGSGIGREAALRLAQGGARVVAAGRDEDRLLSVVAEILHGGGEAQAVVADVRRPESVQSLVAQAVQAYGTIDVLVNSAGVGLIKPLEATAADEIETLLDTNAKGTILVTQAALRPMIAAGKGGHVVNLVGILGKAPMANASIYCASKYAVTGFAKALQLEVGRKHGIKISLMYLGGVDSPFWDAIDMRVQRDKMLTISDAADAVMYALTQPANLVLGEFVLQPDSHQL